MKGMTVMGANPITVESKSPNVFRGFNGRMNLRTNGD